MKLIELKIDKLFLDYSKECWILILSNQDRRISMSIGLLEGAAIDVIFNDNKVLRPMMADIGSIIIRQLGGEIKSIIINDFVDGVYYSLLEIIDASGTIHKIDSRPSDAIALAVRVNAKIYIMEKVLEAFLNSDENLFEKEITINGEKMGEA